MKSSIFAAFILGVAGSALAVPASAGAELPPQAASMSAAQAPSDSPFLSKVDHLRIAAAHLAAAGLKEDAQRILRIAATEDSREPTIFIRVELRMVEVALNKRLATPAEIRDRLPSSDPKLLELIESLSRNGIVEVLAQPSLTVAAGRPATVQVGGMRADVLADVAANNQIHLDFRLRVCQQDYSGNIAIAGQVPVKNREIEAGLDLRSGQTVVVGGRVEWRNSNNGEPVETFVLVRARAISIARATKTATVK